MKGLVFYGQNDIRIHDDLPEPEIQPGRVKIAPKWCGICGSDLHEYLGGAQIVPVEPHPITGECAPVTMGHEFAGEIVEVGEGVTQFKKGDRVCVEPIIWDGTCLACSIGAHNACDKGGFIGLSGWGGGLSDRVVVPQESCYKLPDNISYEIGALIEPLSVGWHAVKASPLKEGDRVLVLGGGPIGLSVIQALVAQGAKDIMVGEVADKRKEFAKMFGATHIIDPSKEDMVARVREIADGEGAHLVFDAAGVQEGLDQGLEALRARGTLVNIALWEKPCSIHPVKILLKEKKYMGVITYARGDFQDVLDAISRGDMQPERMITKKIKLGEVVDEGFGALINDKANQVKILVEPV